MPGAGVAPYRRLVSRDGVHPSNPKKYVNDFSAEALRSNGAIARLLDKSSGIDLVSPRELAENFRLLLLLPGKKTATILGKDQKLSRVTRAIDGLILKWDGPLKDTAGGNHKIAVQMDVKSSGNELQFGGFGCIERPQTE